ncbi:D-erythronate dehydrogenase [Stutzerimonas azotifigens]|uniref:SDR family oxidoreductase n=1 Tax=Stutzerimonas azotifigens TaxID=291995 RepID=A0ABR5YYJ4_9GAMM|nr:D-erythronate dehydrogenase [Stutzerimonas azotifigens]MBA1272951.1 SDR family oxidoreductase [Stutzerimonas azotifigens]
MKILVTGGAGFLGARLIEALLAPTANDLLPAGGTIVSADLAPCPVDDPRVVSHTGDVSDPAFIASLIDPSTTLVYHLAAVVSGQAEADFDLGMRVNFDATRTLLEACRQQAQTPRFVFASSLAVFGGPMPEQVPESLAPLPQSSYGAQKAMAELLINDYSRKGFVDGRVCRLPTISVRPGKPNAAASSFASGILREPLSGEASNCPVPLDTRLWLSSPQTVIDNLLHAARLDGQALGLRRTLNLPGISVRVSEMLDSLARVGGDAARARVGFEPDERVQRIVCSWPGDFDIERPLQLGFRVDADFDSVVKAHQRDMNR